jgi:ribosome biogenesis protein NSA1
MRLITGDECGLLKEIIPGLAKKSSETPLTANAPIATPVTTEQGVHRINNGDRSSRRRGVVAMAWTQPDADKQFSSLHMDGTVEIWERSVTAEKSFGGYRTCRKIQNVFGAQNSPSSASSPDPLSRPLALSVFNQQTEKQLLCACNMAGKVVVFSPAVDDHKDDPILSSFSVFKEPSEKSNYSIVSAMAVDRKFNRVACGGKDREAVLWDLNTAQQVWKAKNLPPDKQTLLQPLVWPTAIQFLNEMDIGTSGQVLAVGTAHKEVRIYDVRMDTNGQRRPISVTPYGLLEHRVTSLCQMDSHRLIVGDAAGFLHTIDLRKLGKKERVRKSIHQTVGTHGRFVGPAGSVQQVVKHSTLPRMAVVGLDRMLRVYDTEKKKQLTCSYLKQRLKCVLVGQDKDAEEEEEDALVNLEDEDIDQEDVVGDYVDSDLEVEEDFEDDIVEDGVDEPASGSGGDDGSDSESEQEVTHSKKKRRQ